MTLDYWDLISPAPVTIPNIGSILSPTLREISAIGIHAYHYFLSLLLMDAKTYLAMTGQIKPDQAQEPCDADIFDLFVSNAQSASLLNDALNFFFKETVAFSETDECFVVTGSPEHDKVPVIGVITKENYPQLRDLICQRNNLKPQDNADPSKVKSKKALEIMKKLQKGRNATAKHTKTDKNLELGNIISAVANKHPSLNILNIWDLTVYQLWDTFSRLSNNSIYAIQSMSVAAWGNQNNSFDAASWFHRIDET